MDRSHRLSTPCTEKTRVGLVGLALAGATTLAVAACSAAPTSTEVEPTGPVGPTTVRLLTHDSFALSEDLVADLRADTGITLEIVPAGDAGELVSKAALTAGNPEGDVLFGVDSTLLTRALDAGVFTPYRSPQLEALRPELVDDTAGGRVTPIDYGDVCINVDDTWFDERELTPPRDLDALLDPAYRDLLVVQNPATSSPGLAFLLATIARYGEGGWQGYWTALRANGVQVVNGWTEAYAGAFTKAGGDRPLVVSYASSPPAEIVYAAEPRPDSPGTSVVTDGCYRQVEYAGILAGTEQRAAARVVIDWLLSPEVQADVPLSMFVFPARADVTLPPVFEEFAAVPLAPLSLPADEIAEHREEWVDTWTDVVLR